MKELKQDSFWKKKKFQDLGLGKDILDRTSEECSIKENKPGASSKFSMFTLQETALTQ